MDLEEISGPKVPDGKYPPLRGDELQPVNKYTRLPRIKERAYPYEFLDLWSIKDRVTISAEGYRRYRNMQAARQKYLSSNSKHIDY